MTDLAERPTASRRPHPPIGDDTRQPPQDLDAEKSVLGGMLLSKDAIADVVEKVGPDDFYQPSHRTVFGVILDLYGRGEPADAVTIAAELDRRGLLQRIGGAPYLHTLIATVPTAANASYYAGIVAEKAVLRRLVEAGTRVVQFGYAGADGADVAEVVDRAQSEIYAVTDRRSTSDITSLADLLEPTLEELDSMSSTGQSRGVPTGFPDLDNLTNGLHPGQMVVVAARPGVGKALAVDTPLPTPTGWTTMADIEPGDLLLDAAGLPTRVVAATPVMFGRPCYELTFSDGSRLVADAQHQWPTAGGLRTSRQLWRTMRHTTDAIPLVESVALAHRTPHPAHPGGTRARADNRDDHRATRTAQPLSPVLTAAPPAAIDSPVATRCRVQRHAVVQVRPVPSVAVRCVEVNNTEHLYLAGRSGIPTHNSTLALDFMRSCSLKHQLPSVIFSLEMSKSEIVMRLLSAEAKVKLQSMRAGKMSDDDWAGLGRCMSRIGTSPLYIDDSPNLTMMEIRAKARRLRQRCDLRLIVVDYMQLMSSGKRVESRQQEVSEFSRSLKLMAKELEVPVVALSQLNRGPEQRSDKRPQLSDLRESGSIEQDSDVVVLLHRPDAFERDDPRAGEADLIVAKHRNGPTATVTVAHQLHLSRFAPMSRL